MEEKIYVKDECHFEDPAHFEYLQKGISKELIEIMDKYYLRVSYDFYRNYFAVTDKYDIEVVGGDLEKLVHEQAKRIQHAIDEHGSYF